MWHVRSTRDRGLACQGRNAGQEAALPASRGASGREQDLSPRHATFVGLECLTGSSGPKPRQRGLDQRLSLAPSGKIYQGPGGQRVHQCHGSLLITHGRGKGNAAAS